MEPLYCLTVANRQLAKPLKHPHGITKHPRGITKKHVGVILRAVVWRHSFWFVWVCLVFRALARCCVLVCGRVSAVRFAQAGRCVVCDAVLAKLRRFSLGISGVLMERFGGLMELFGRHRRPLLYCVGCLWAITTVDGDTRLHRAVVLHPPGSSHMFLCLLASSGWFLAGLSSFGVLGVSLVFVGVIWCRLVSICVMLCSLARVCCLWRSLVFFGGPLFVLWCSFVFVGVRWCSSVFVCARWR